jgi:hypothetical protein
MLKDEIHAKEHSSGYGEGNTYSMWVFLVISELFAALVPARDILQVAGYAEASCGKYMSICGYFQLANFHISQIKACKQRKRQ